MPGETATIEELRLEIRIKATPEQVWKALTDDIARWWPGVFYCGGGAGKPVFKLEARPGGRMFEDWGDGEGLLWGTIAQVRRNKTLALNGISGPAWGGPSASFASFDLAADGDETVLTFVEAAFGRIPDTQTAEKEKGWRFLLDGSLRAHLEGTEPPEWQD